MKKEVKENRVLFRVDSTMLKQLDELSEKLKLKRPQVIRFGIDELIAKHTHPGHKGDLTILDTKFLNTILTNLGNRIFELENPRGTPGSRIREREAEIAKKQAEKRAII